MTKRHELECGCTFEGDQDNWKPCAAHTHSSLNKVRKAHGECLPMERCSNCHQMKVQGETCRQCGVGPRIGG